MPSIRTNRPAASPSPVRLREGQAEFVKRLPPEDRKNVFVDSLIRLGRSVQVEDRRVVEVEEEFSNDHYEKTVRSLVEGFGPMVSGQVRDEVELFARLAYVEEFKTESAVERDSLQETGSMYARMRKYLMTRLRQLRANEQASAMEETTIDFEYLVRQVYEVDGGNSYGTQMTHFMLNRYFTGLAYNILSWPFPMISDSCRTSVERLYMKLQELSEAVPVERRSAVFGGSTFSEFRTNYNRVFAEVKQELGDEVSAPETAFRTGCMILTNYLTTLGITSTPENPVETYWNVFKQLMLKVFQVRKQQSVDVLTKIDWRTIPPSCTANVVRKLLAWFREWHANDFSYASVINHYDRAVRQTLETQDELHVQVDPRAAFALAFLTLQGSMINQDTWNPDEPRCVEFIRRVAMFGAYWLECRACNEGRIQANDNLVEFVELRARQWISSGNVGYGGIARHLIATVYNRSFEPHWTSPSTAYVRPLPEFKFDAICDEPEDHVDATLPELPAELPTRRKRKFYKREILNTRHVRVTAEFANEEGAEPKTMAFACNANGDYLVTTGNNGRGKSVATTRGLSIITCLRHLGMTLINPELL